MLDKYKLPMPNQNLSDAEIKEFAAYFTWADTNLRPQAKEQTAPAPPKNALSSSPAIGPADRPSAQNDKAKS
jgi:nitrite reductase (NO-forming)